MRRLAGEVALGERSCRGSPPSGAARRGTTTSRSLSCAPATRASGATQLPQPRLARRGTGRSTRDGRRVAAGAERADREEPVGRVRRERLPGADDLGRLRPRPAREEVRDGRRRVRAQHEVRDDPEVAAAAAAAGPEEVAVLRSRSQVRWRPSAVTIPSETMLSLVVPNAREASPTPPPSASPPMPTVGARAGRDRAAVARERGLDVDQPRAGADRHGAVRVHRDAVEPPQVDDEAGGRRVAGVAVPARARGDPDAVAPRPADGRAHVGDRDAAARSRAGGRRRSARCRRAARGRTRRRRGVITGPRTSRASARSRGSTAPAASRTSAHGASEAAATSVPARARKARRSSSSIAAIVRAPLGAAAELPAGVLSRLRRSQMPRAMSGSEIGPTEQRDDGAEDQEHVPVAGTARRAVDPVAHGEHRHAGDPHERRARRSAGRGGNRSRRGWRPRGPTRPRRPPRLNLARSRRSSARGR